MTKILLVNPPFDIIDGLGAARIFIQKYEPLGLLYIAASTREAGYDVGIIDAFTDDMTMDLVKKELITQSPDIIGITTLTGSGAGVYELGGWIKTHMPHTLVVLGNIHASIFARQYLANNCCDVVVHGEGDEVFPWIVRCHASGDSLSEIPGISYKNQDGIIHQSNYFNTVENLSVLPFPARDILKTRQYGLNPISNQLYVASSGSKVKTMLTSRGCPNRCSFCAVHHNNKPRFNDPVKVVDEMEHLVKTYHTEYIYIVDSLFIADKARLIHICKEITRRNLSVRWGAQAHVNYLSADILGPMEKAGCHDLAIGIESGVQRILDRVEKNIDLKKVVSVINMVKKNSRIKLEGLFILGLPGETYDEALQTISFAKKQPLDMAQFSIFTPYPGSPFYDELRDKNEIDTGIRANDRVDPSVWHRYFAYPAFNEIEPIWTNPGMTTQRLIKLQKRAQREFYLRLSIMIRNIKRIRINNIAILFRIIKQGMFT
ncbi:MAG: radical SAM protein [Elusimicrobia bacterium]|nr:radical SAM protein [Elusimicrobiota bacterium]